MFCAFSLIAIYNTFFFKFVFYPRYKSKIESIDEAAESRYSLVSTPDYAVNSCVENSLAFPNSKNEIIIISFLGTIQVITQCNCLPDAGY